MDAKIDKTRSLQWATSVLREAVDAGTYGNITFSMQNGIIGNAKRETNMKPIIDSDRDKE